MISIIIPCISVEKGIKTAKNVLKKIQNKTEIIIVNDGQPRNNHYSSEDLTIYELKGINGSYFCRNFGASKSCGNWLYFLDSDVSFTNKFSIDINQNEIGYFNVVFNREPKNKYEKWYYDNAFKIDFFIKYYNFVPTISLIVSRENFNSINGFNAKLFSSGDVDFCNRLNLKYKKIYNTSLVANLREKDAIFLKLKRQVLGHCINKINSSNKLFYFSFVFIKILKNFISGTIYFWHNKEYSSIYFYKSKLALECLISPESLKRKIILTNKREVQLDL